MGVFKRTIKGKNTKREYWYIDYTVNGRRKWESVGRVGVVAKADAKKLLALRNTEILQGKFHTPKQKVIPIFQGSQKSILNMLREIRSHGKGTDMH